MTTRDLLRRASSLPFQKLDQEVLIVDPRTRAVHLLNATAARVWELLETAATRAQLLATLSLEFEAAPEVIELDLAKLLGELEQRGLIGPDPAHESAGAP